MTMEQESRSEAQHCDLSPVRPADRNNAGDERLGVSIFCRWGGMRQPRSWSDEIGRIDAGQLTPDRAVAKTAVAKTAEVEPGAADLALEFGRFRLLPRRRQLVADGMPIELGSRGFDLLLALLEADGSLVSKDALLRRVWLGLVVTEENLKVQISKLRKALGKDRDYIRTEFGRGYRFTGKIRSTMTRNPGGYPTGRRYGPRLGWLAEGFCCSPRQGGGSRDRTVGLANLPAAMRPVPLKPV
jgi:DNA-binding winged helix-turn-helix (wHTH) protein